jgi:hypothetical protein
MSKNHLPSEVALKAALHNALKNRLSREEVRGIFAYDDDGISLAASVAWEMGKPLYYVLTDESGRKVLNASFPGFGLQLHMVAYDIRDIEAVKTGRKLVESAGGGLKKQIFAASLPSDTILAQLKEMGLGCERFTI